MGTVLVFTFGTSMSVCLSWSCSHHSLRVASWYPNSQVSHVGAPRQVPFSSPQQYDTRKFLASTFWKQGSQFS